MPLILRSVKGSKLSIPEMDGNLTYLVSTLSGSVIQVTGSSINASNTIISASNLFIDNNIDTQNRALYDSSNTLSVNWEDYTLNNSTGVILDWGDYTLIGSNTIASADWENRILYDSTGNSSIDWEIRALNDISSNNVVEWETGIFQPSSDDSVSLGNTNKRFRGGFISRTFTVGDPNSVRTTISAVDITGAEYVGSIQFTTGSTAPTTSVTEGTMFVGKAGANYYINVFIGGRWRSSSLL
jgi:hypothetical protein